MDRFFPLAKTEGRWLLAGQSGSGKTKFLCDTLLRWVAFDYVVLCCPKASQGQLCWKQIARKYGEYFKVYTPEEAEGELFPLLEKAHALQWRTLVVLDDLATRTGLDKPWINQLIISGRHLGASVAILTQSIFPKGSRILRVNCDLLCIWKFGAQSEMKTLAHQLCTDKQDAIRLTEAYKQAIKRPHGFRLIDLKSESTKELPLRVRAGVGMETWKSLVPELYDVC